LNAGRQNDPAPMSSSHSSAILRAGEGRQMWQRRDLHEGCKLPLKAGARVRLPYALPCHEGDSPSKNRRFCPFLPQFCPQLPSTAKKYLFPRVSFACAEEPPFTQPRPRLYETVYEMISPADVFGG
jgi:hypothetical protein